MTEVAGGPEVVRNVREFARRSGTRRHPRGNTSDGLSLCEPLGMGTHTRCWYCSRRDVELTDEHVLSLRNFGGRLVTRGAVCQSCNATIGKLERQMACGAFLAEYVGRDRLPRSLARPGRSAAAPVGQ